MTTLRSLLRRDAAPDNFRAAAGTVFRRGAHVTAIDGLYLGYREDYLQKQQNLVELAGCLDWPTVPQYHAERWTELTLDTAERIPANHCITCPEACAETGVAYPLPETLQSLRSAALLQDGIAKPTRSWSPGVDWWFDTKFCYFAVDPLTDQEDTTQTLWIWRGEFDAQYAERFLHPLISAPGGSSERAIGATQAILRGVSGKSAWLPLRQFLAAICGSPVAAYEETVLATLTHVDRKPVVITDKATYRASGKGVSINVSSGKKLLPGDPLFDGFAIQDWQEAVVASDHDVDEVTLSRYATGLSADVVFVNQQVPITSADPVRWEFPDDGDVFWDYLAEDETALKSVVTGLIGNIEVGKTVNPLDVLYRTVLRHGGVTVQILAEALTPEAAEFLPLIRRIVSPHCLLLIDVHGELPPRVTLPRTICCHRA